MSTTYEIITEANILISTLYEYGGEIPEGEDPIGEWANKAEDKLAALAMVKRKLESEATLMRTEEKRLASRRSGMEKNIVRVHELLRELLLKTEELTGEPKVKRPDMTVWLQTTNAVSVADVSMLPLEYVTVKTTQSANKKALKEALTTGESVEGAELIETRGVRIR